MQLIGFHEGCDVCYRRICLDVVCCTEDVVVVVTRNAGNGTDGIGASQIVLCTSLNAAPSSKKKGSASISGWDRVGWALLAPGRAESG